MSLPDVSDYNRQLNSERLTFSGLRRDLASELSKLGAPDHTEDEVILYAEELGPTMPRASYPTNRSSSV